MDVSIIIVNLNAGRLLEDCLASIYACTSDVSVEIIVVDNHSSDGSAAMVKAKFPQVRLVENPYNRRYAIANNQGLALARGRCVLYLNNDILLHGNTIRELYEFLEMHSNAGGVGGRLISADGGHQDSCFRFPSAFNLFYLVCLARFYWQTPLAGKYAADELAMARPVDFVVGACFMARRDLLEQCQGMDADFYLYGEDSDLCYRMQQRGWTVWYLPTSAPVVHYGGASTTQLFGDHSQERLLWGWKARFLFVKKHASFWQKLGILAGMVAGFGVNVLLYSLACCKRWDFTSTRRHLRFHWTITREAFRIF
ncbi:glycosyltransferase [candidate division KSB3 bacterium]|uniref:Glycosyltransferase n=1 Tax=candidate division KSB3 bacterium TaxID=2044937 RepID=A0A9D5JT60_9BACT|nr:glycosyltransferase [candidate division KSB3 bacterium]MBD3323512.1 glycosyltransferase [candidate division KSB3 bacterium]